MSYLLIGFAVSMFLLPVFNKKYGIKKTLALTVVLLGTVVLSYFMIVSLITGNM